MTWDENVLVFKRGGYRFAVDVASVRRVVQRTAAQAVPVPAAGVEGMTESAGDVHTLMTTCLPEPTPSSAGWSRWVLLRGSAAIGFEVDEVEGVRSAVPRGEDDLPEDALPHKNWATLITRPVLVDGATAWVVDVEALIRTHMEAA